MYVWAINPAIQLGRDVPGKLGSPDFSELTGQECRPALERVPWLKAIKATSEPKGGAQQHGDSKPSPPRTQVRISVWGPP